MTVNATCASLHISVCNMKVQPYNQSIYTLRCSWKTPGHSWQGVKIHFARILFWLSEDGITCHHMSCPIREQYIRALNELIIIVADYKYQGICHGHTHTHVSPSCTIVWLLFMQTPGPGTYQVVDSQLYGARSPAYSILGRTQLPGDNSKKPDPGAYNPEKVLWARGCRLTLYSLHLYLHMHRLSFVGNKLHHTHSAQSTQNTLLHAWIW